MKTEYENFISFTEDYVLVLKVLLAPVVILILVKASFVVNYGWHTLETSDKGGNYLKLIARNCV